MRSIGGNSHPVYLFHIVLYGFGGIVGDENIASSIFFNLGKKIQRSFKN